MFGLLRPGSFAAAFVALSVMFAGPSLAAEAPAAAVASQGLSVSVPASAAVTKQYNNGASAKTATAFTAPRPRPLRDLVVSFVDYGDQDAEQLCLAKAIYFEARGESLEGQLAVAEVVLNRAASGRYPPTICAVVTQPAQFSFIQAGKFPSLDREDPMWRKALAIADIARKGVVRQIATNVLWYHADYVAPSWGRRLTRTAQIGTHIFYS